MPKGPERRLPRPVQRHAAAGAQVHFSGIAGGREGLGVNRVRKFPGGHGCTGEQVYNGVTAELLPEDLQRELCAAEFTAHLAPILNSAEYAELAMMVRTAEENMNAEVSAFIKSETRTEKPEKTEQNDEAQEGDQKMGDKK